MQTVRELNKRHTQVAAGCHKQFAEVFGLLGLRAGKLQVGQLGHTIDKFGNLIAKPFGHLGICRLGVLDSVMQQRRHKGRVIHLLFCKDGRDGNRVGVIWLARMTELPLVHVLAISKGITQQ